MDEAMVGQTNWEGCRMSSKVTDGRIRRWALAPEAGNRYSGFHLIIQKGSFPREIPSPPGGEGRVSNCLKSQVVQGVF